MRYPTKYDVIVIGAGHAGIEAALASARLGAKTLVLTISLDNVGRMSCNPAIGGPAKSHLVREVDALGGEIGKAADQTHVQLKMLNLSKGPAVHSLRSQNDRLDYIRYMKSVLENTPNLDLKQGMATELIMQGKRFQGVRTREGYAYYGQALVLATGTFLRGKIYTGLQETPAGRAGEFPAEELTKSLNKIGIKTGRLKTGTPPRINGRSVNFKKTKKEPGMKKKKYFSFSTVSINRKQLPCYLTYTNKKTHQIILNNLDRSPLYQGMIDGVGPRYCPSIEDKVVRFKDKERHQLFIEPEGFSTQEMYVQGMSTSLPYDIQLKFLRTIPGLENVEITRPGYAVAYDFIFSEQLEQTLAIRQCAGVYSAGQINGTSGYEEAAAQGIIAGINAARYVQKKESFVLTREESYIGTMIDDLIHKEIREPYRMMTSRSEYRLFLRQDNADSRLLKKGHEVGLVDKKTYTEFMQSEARIQIEKEQLSKTKARPTKDIQKKLHKLGEKLNQPTTFFQLLKRPALTYEDLSGLGYTSKEELSEWEKEKLLIEIRYADYIKKVQDQLNNVKKTEYRKLPREFDYRLIKSLSNEAKEKLNKFRPQTLGEASRIAGVNPADITVLLIWLETRRRKANVSHETN